MVRVCPCLCFVAKSCMLFSLSPPSLPPLLSPPPSPQSPLPPSVCQQTADSFALLKTDFKRVGLIHDYKVGGDLLGRSQHDEEVGGKQGVIRTSLGNKQFVLKGRPAFPLQLIIINTFLKR